MQKLSEDIVFLTGNASVQVGAEGADARLEAATKLWQRARLTKLEFQAGRVLLHAKTKSGQLADLQTQCIQETGKDPKAEVYGPLSEVWAVALAKP